MGEQDLIKCIEQTLKSEETINFEAKIAGTSGIAEGYLSTIYFFEVNYTDKNSGKRNVLNLAMKCSHSDAKKNLPFISQVFLEEIAIYSRVFPALQKFQIERNVKNIFNNYPKYYGSIINDNIDAIILENLKHAGYQINDRRVPLTRHHLKITLEAYAKFHATSMVFNNQKPDEFLIMAPKTNFAKTRLEERNGFAQVTNVFFNTILTLLKERNKPALHKQLENYLRNDLVKQLLDLIGENTGFSVIIHLDAWNNNYLFKYNGDNKIPEDVKIIDWQMTDVVNSPIYDVSHFLYNCSSLEDLNNLEHLLEHYYKFFSQHLSDLGCDPNKFFPYSLLKEHWKKFSLFGFFYVPYVIKQSYWDETDAPNVSEIKDWCTETNNIVVKDERYYERLFGIVDHHLNYKL